MSARSGNDLRAGMFVLLGLAILVGAIVLLGQKNALFSRNTTLYVNFSDISGLVEGAPVRLAGMDVGTVAAIALPSDLEKKKARVTLAVQSEYMPRIRRDSRAIIDSNGLLGDKIVNVSMGDPEVPELRPGATLKTGETLTFEAMSNSLHEAIESIRGVTKGVEGLVEGLNESHVQEDVATITGALAGILSEVQKGDGLVHRLVYDKRYASHFSAILVDLQGLTSTTSRAMSRLDGVLVEVERGDGTLHEVVYGQGGKQAIRELEVAAKEIGEVVREVREGNGLVHTLVYDEGNTNFLRELNEASVTLNRITQEIDQGRGTVGGLLKDPTVYEDLKTILGNIKRNVVFKALVRFTIEDDGMRQPENAPAVRAPVTPVAPFVTPPIEGPP